MEDARPVIPLDERLARWRCTRGYVEDVAAAIGLAVVDSRAAGRVYNIGEQSARCEADWVHAIGRAAGWQGEVVAVHAGRLAVPGNTEQDIAMDTSRIRRELAYAEPTPASVALERTVRWERANLPTTLKLDYLAEDALLAGIGGEPGA
jgi:nucleoside-diphosphate-sugar epimerase